MQTTFQIIAKTFKGLEQVLAKELIGLGANDVEIQRRAVACSGDKFFLYKANLHLRTASRLLVPIMIFRAKNADEIYDKVKDINWEEYLDVNNTFSIDSTVFSEKFTHSKFVAYRVKDAIVDQFNEKYSKRPSVSISNPDIYINIHIANDQCTVSLDSSGESLHKRGYRDQQTEAPINEALAAGMLLLAGWEGQKNFIDPMCGSGTFLIEAALIALNISPGIFRKSFAFEKWKNFDKELFDEIYNDESMEKEFAYKIFGSDASQRAIKVTEQNIKSAGLSKYIEIKQANINEFKVEEGKYLMVTNPPYGERIKSSDIYALYETIGRVLKHDFIGNEAWVISSDKECLYKVGLKPSQKIQLLNGDIECQYCQYEIFGGKRNDFVRSKKENRST